MSYRLNDDDHEQIDFLQQQVRRLTAVVQEYQRRYLPIDERLVEPSPLLPWITDSSMLSPLLVEYDENIKALKEQVHHYKVEYDVLREKSIKIVEENERLHEKLRNTVEHQLDAMHQSNDERIQRLQHEMKQLRKEKEDLTISNDDISKNLLTMKNELNNKGRQIEMLSSEIDSLQDDLGKARSFAENTQLANKKLKEEQEHFLKTAQAQDNELDNMRMQNRKLNGELKTMKALSGELQSHNSKLKEQLKLLDKGASSVETIPSAEGTIRQLRTEIVELDSRVVSYSKELYKLRMEKADLEEQLSALKKKNNVIEENEYQAILRVRDSVQLVENALLEREQAIVQEQQKSVEVSRLQEAMTNLIQKAEKQKMEEISDIQAQCNKQLHQMSEDLHAHEIDEAEMQVLISKLQREKMALEQELKKVYEEAPTEALKAGLTLDEMQKKLAKVELGKDEALLQIDKMQINLRRNQSRWESDKNILLNQVTDYKKQITKLKADLDDVSQSRIHLLDEVNSLKKSLQSKREGLATLDMSCTSQVTKLQQTIQIKEKEFEAQLRSVEDVNRSAMNELRSMLTLQQKNGAKWRDESRTLCQKFERTISQLRAENEELKNKNEIIISDFDVLQEKYDKLNKENYMKQVSYDKLQRLSADSEEQAEAAKAQVMTLLNREKQLLGDRKSLNKEVDKLRMELSRPNRTRTMEKQWDHFVDTYE